MVPDKQKDEAHKDEGVQAEKELGHERAEGRKEVKTQDEGKDVEVQQNEVKVQQKEVDKDVKEQQKQQVSWWSCFILSRMRRRFQLKEMQRNLDLLIIQIATNLKIKWMLIRNFTLLICQFII